MRGGSRVISQKGLSAVGARSDRSINLHRRTSRPTSQRSSLAPLVTETVRAKSGRDVLPWRFPRREHALRLSVGEWSRPLQTQSRSRVAGCAGRWPIVRNGKDGELHNRFQEYTREGGPVRLARPPAAYVRRPRDSVVARSTGRKAGVGDLRRLIGETRGCPAARRPYTEARHRKPREARSGGGRLFRQPQKAPIKLPVMIGAQVDEVVQGVDLRNPRCIGKILNCLDVTNLDMGRVAAGLTGLIKIGSAQSKACVAADRPRPGFDLCHSKNPNLLILPACRAKLVVAALGPVDRASASRARPGFGGACSPNRVVHAVSVARRVAELLLPCGGYFFTGSDGNYPTAPSASIRLSEVARDCFLTLLRGPHAAAGALRRDLHPFSIDQIFCGVNVAGSSPAPATRSPKGECRQRRLKRALCTARAEIAKGAAVLCTKCRRSGSSPDCPGLLAKVPMGASRGKWRRQRHIAWSGDVESCNRPNSGILQRRAHPCAAVRGPTTRALSVSERPGRLVRSGPFL